MELPRHRGAGMSKGFVQRPLAELFALVVDQDRVVDRVLRRAAGENAEDVFGDTDGDQTRQTPEQNQVPQDGLAPLSPVPWSPWLVFVLGSKKFQEKENSCRVSFEIKG